MNMRTKILILAGGSGTRLWPYSTERLPKQFLSIGGRESSFSQAVTRALTLAAPENIFISTNQANAPHARRQLRNTPVDKQNILVKEANYDTGLSIVGALCELAERDLLASDDCIVVLPSDHHIEPVSAFTKTLEQALHVASKHAVVVAICKTPESPEASFGYMVLEPENSADGFRKVLSFVEKPAREKAEELIAAGNAFWNLGMYVSRADVLLSEYERYFGISHIESAPRNELFTSARDIPFDVMISETSSRLVAVPAEFQWLDVGSWRAMHDLSEKDTQTNALLADTVLIDTTESLFVGGPKPIVGIHLEELLVVDHRDALLILSKKHVDSLKKALPMLKEKYPQLVRGLPFVSVCTVIDAECNESTRMSVESIVSQKYPFIEQVIIADAEKCKRLEGEVAAVVSDTVHGAPEKVIDVLPARESGFYPRLNQALRESTGDIIGILDAGDAFADPDALVQVVETMEREHVDIAWGDMVYAPSGSTAISRFWRSSPYKPGLFKKGWMPPSAALFIRRSVFDQYGLFRTDMPHAASYELMLRLLEKGHIRGVYIPRILVRRTGKSASLLRRIKGVLQANIEAYRAWRIHGLAVSPWFILRKPFLKGKQLFARSRPIDL